MNLILDLEPPVYRPPSEARSLLVQVTLGCSNNKCTYCAMYQTKKYRVRPLDEIISDIDSIKAQLGVHMWPSGKVFLCDGDALGAPMEILVPVLEHFRKAFPAIRRFGIYATAENILAKSEADLRQLADLGLNTAYLGMESGNDRVLELVKKGNTAAEMLEAGLKIKAAGWKLSVIAMLGLGGTRLSVEHCRDTGVIISRMAPQFFSFLSTTPVPKTPYARSIDRGEIEPLTTKALLQEMKDILEAIEPDKGQIIFRANHVSNMFPLGGTLPKDKGIILNQLDQWISQCPDGQYPNINPEYL